eukprot:TRINITY_DN15765_c0_g1_i1.p1 TRINITY_DN15765_c0_g1~~TRINITY_DN15765_c0_g1_i1.p1  ORF type:complete len:304 (+),score=87.19 TRINITY_DN15765_c0_g1_i1:131-1042(+)
MAHTALNDDEITEFYDDEERVKDCVLDLANQIRKCGEESVVIYTGAGISTSAGISDFRGPNGVWTRAKKIKEGKSVPKLNPRPQVIKPTFGHMSFVGLANAGYLDCVISTNCDGLHIKSGLPIKNLLELHGNTNIEACPNCGACAYRDYHVGQFVRRNTARITGALCEKENCNGKLRCSDVAFNQSLPDLCLEEAIKRSKNAKVVIILGSSMRVAPACKLPFVNKKAYSCIVNLQRTPYDDRVTNRVFTKTDEFLNSLMEELECDVPEYEVLDLVNDPEFLQEFENDYKFRTAPDDSWFAGSY